MGVGVEGNTGGTDQQPADADEGKASGESKVKCKQTKVDPEPPAGHAVWKGQDPKKADLYFSACADGGENNPDGFIVVPDGEPAPAVDPAVLAQRAVDSMTLNGPEIGITPNPGKTGVVGMPVWMWNQQSPTTSGPNTASASAGGITVKATAKVSKVVWSMGDGSKVTCTKPGTPYKASYGKRMSPDCGHVYEETSGSRPEGTFTVKATSTWEINWAGGGQSGQLTEIRESDVEIEVGEVQVLG
ncbi:ATP/GTP-binding protein [Streptomyces sp. 8N706]|uniref:ATP/GTP-binding protein n=1 Tax=Streptomyces sp. 8N706 TaxID=3457416 RepID=UPI003FD594FA